MRLLEKCDEGQKLEIGRLGHEIIQRDIIDNNCEQEDFALPYLTKLKSIKEEIAVHNKNCKKCREAGNSNEL